jgi:PHD/YefM family antitoxin component YafN of YafNO toxin-antitoxin module
MIIAGRNVMKRITIEEFEKDFDYYLELSTKEDVYIVKDKKDIAVCISPEQYRSIQSFKGSIK